MAPRSPSILGDLTRRPGNARQLPRPAGAIKALLTASLAACGIIAAGSVAFVASAAQAPTPRFRSGVEVIEVAVVVRDRDGRVVGDLTESEISVRENDVPQRILAFERVSIPVLRPPSVVERQDPLVARDVSTNERVTESRVFVLVLDALHTAATRTIAVRQHARRFVEEYVGPNDMAAVVSPGADSAATQDFTTDKARLVAAIAAFTGTKLKSYTQESAGPFGIGGAKEKEKIGPDSERAYRALALTDSLQAVAEHLEHSDARRKALLLFSEGIDYDTGDVMGRYQRYASEVAHAMARPVAALMRTNTVLYTIDPRGLSTPQGDLTADPIHSISPGDPEYLSEQDFAREFERSVWTLRDLARLTGGFLATDKGLRRAFEQIVEENSNYYLVRYAPEVPPKPGQSRRIAVRVSRPGVQVVARSGYTAPRAQAQTARVADPELTLPQRGMPRPRPGSVDRFDAPARTSTVVTGVAPDLARLLTSPLPKPGLPLRVQTISFKAGEEKGDVQIIIEVLGAGLRFVERGGQAEERLELALMTVDRQGRAANGRSTTIALRLPPGELERVRTTGVRWLSKLQLRSGSYQLRVGGRADRTGATGLVTHSFEVPRFPRRRLAMSGITLTSLPAVIMPTRGTAWLQKTLPTPPSAARTFVRGDRVTAAVELYSAETAERGVELVAEVLTARGATVLTANGTSHTTDSTAGARAVGFTVDTSPLAPGEYVLRIASVTPAPDRLERRVPFDVIPHAVNPNDRP